MRRALYGLILPLVVLSAGCREEDSAVGGVLRDKSYNSIVSLSPSTTEIALSQGLTSVLKGRTQACNFPEGSTKNIPVVASLKPDYEKIATVKPGLVLFDADIYNEQDVAKIQELGADVFTIDATTIDEFSRQLYRFGSLTGTETNASAYVDKILAARTEALGDPIEPAPKVAVMLSGSGGSEHMVAGTQSFVADVVRAAGGEPIGPEAKKFERANPEFILSQDPDFIVLGVTVKDKALSERQVAAILNDPRMRTLAAVAKRRIIGIDQDVLLRRGSRVDKLIERMHESLAAKGALN